MQFLRRAPSTRMVANVVLFITFTTFLGLLTSMAYAGHMGWVYEDNELRASYPDKTWWLVGDRVRLSTYIVNMDETRTMEGAYADVFLISPSGERINVTRVRIRETYPLRAGEMRSFEIEWDSTGYEPGNYRLEMVGEADFEYGEDKELSNFMDGAVKLFAWDHPVFRPRVVEVELPKTEFVPGEPFTCDVTVENQGNVPAFPVTFMTLRGENDTVWRPQMMDEPGVIYKEGERYTSHFKTWLPNDLPPGTYSCEVNVFCFAAWPSTDGSGWTPWPSGDSAYSAPWPEYTGECYYPYPMEDPSLGYPLVLDDGTWLYLPWPGDGYDGIWPWPEDVSFSPPEDDSPCTEAAECGEGVFGWSDYLCEHSYGPSTCQSLDCGEIEVEEPFYSCEIVDYAFTDLPLGIGEECVLLAEVSNDGNTPVETDWYVFTIEDESIVTVDALPSRIPAECDTVIELYTEFDDIDPGDYTLEINMEGHSPWPDDVGEWMRSEYIIPNLSHILDDEGATHSEAWLYYAGVAEEYGAWPTYRVPGQTGGGTQGVLPEFDSMDSFFDVFFEIDFSDTPLITDSPNPVLVGIEEPTTEPETPPEGEPLFSDWLIGDEITVTATIYNTGELPIIAELGTVFGAMPTGATFVIGNIDDSASIGPGDYKEYPFVWSSEGAPAGTYSMSLGGAVGFSDGSGQMLYNFEPNAWVLVDPNVPRLEPTIYDVSFMQATPSTLMGGVTVFNDGTVPFFPLFHFGLVGEDGSFYQLPTWDLPGTLFMPGQAYYYPFVTWIPEDVPSGTYGWSMLMESVTAWPSVDGSGHLPWYPGSGAVGAEGPPDPSMGYYPFPTTDPELGYPVETEDDTDFYTFTLAEPSSVSIPTNPWMTDSVDSDCDFGWAWYLEDFSEGTHTLYVEVSDDLYDTEAIGVDRGLYRLEITVEEMPDVLLYGDNVITVELENDCPEVYLTDWTLDLWNEDGDEYTCPLDVPDATCSPGINSYDLTCEIPESIPSGEYCGEVTAECEIARQMAADDILGGPDASRPLGTLDTLMDGTTLGIAPKDTSSWTSSAQSKPAWDSFKATYTEGMEDGTGTQKPTYLDSEGEGTISKYYLENCPYEVGRGEPETPVDVSGDDPEDDKKSGDIPGFPYESVLIGLAMGITMLSLVSQAKRGWVLH